VRNIKNAGIAKEMEFIKNATETKEPWEVRE
jgi:hypothetical protein